ncbi:ATP-dependent transcriptional regulator, MalT-like, LuxR family [Georgfuchsia toluolica]|uniref:ATP-dependent transcriptional regulator, MalT-like, LuxR family n=1 Tax=Georgfuchsia toluolica TaxID=424218 RepID=A0A916J468_9PROT|nr:LuxR C-terminal-related transcriptional regulator [Georgfuchsia toluolica]CAG4883668.1 ATP-dependent transcriptional regulator, MalT-like, LuxR family [Georgfuchsia toluolica]
MSTVPRAADNSIPELLLKTMPPRSPRHLLVRPRLGLDDEQFRDQALTIVQAPAGFGKTSLLAQWRREHLARGAAVAWISADGSEDPMRFMLSLILAVRSGCGRSNFGRGLSDGAISSLGELDGITAWLAEIAQTALQLVLVVDEAERLAPARFEGLSYLIHNAPANLRLVVAARGGLDPIFADLAAYGHCSVVGPEQLRFRSEETLSLVRGRFGNRVDADTCARLHEITEGWPLGLQIALTAMERVADPRLAVDAMFARGRGQREQLVAGLLAGFSADESDFLVRVAVADLIHPDLCVALTGRTDAAEMLARLVRDTPIFVVGDDGEWVRLHNLARDALRARFDRLPEAERKELHSRAMHWMTAHGMIEHAARHAHAAGQREAACQLAEQGLYDAVLSGQQAAVFEWLDILTPDELSRFPRLRLAAAWALALSERHEEAGRLVADIQENPDVDPDLRYECALILSGAAYYGDLPDRCVEVFAPWIDAAPPKHPRLRQMHANRLSFLALLAGDPGQARRYYQQALSRKDVDPTQAYAARVGEFAIGLSYVWEGQIKIAEDFLRPVLARTDMELGRRHPLSSMLSALLAAAVYERDELDEAVTLLANRLDVLERVGTPETALLGYRTAARIAAAQGMEHRALDLLEALHAIGVSRSLPRLCIVSFAEQARLHAGRFRAETCRMLVERMDKTIAMPSVAEKPLLFRAMEHPRLMAHAWAAIAAQDWGRAGDLLAQAAQPVEAMRLGRARIEIMGLRAIALKRTYGEGDEMLREAWNLARTYGLMRTLVDAHPLLGDAAQRIAEEDPRSRMAGVLTTARAIRPGGLGAKVPHAVPSMVLTPKEREVLELLARNMSNKEVALALDVGEETVKWHVKNLFGKLDAGTRKHAVRRAQMLGLLEGSE